MNAQAAPAVDPLADFAKSELAARAAAAPPPGVVQGVVSEVPEARDPQADALDAEAVLSLFAKSGLLLITRNRRADPVRADKLKQRRESVAKKCGGRIALRVGLIAGRLIGDWLLAVGLAAEFAGEFLDDALDERELELRTPEETAQRELPFGTPPQEARS